MPADLHEQVESSVLASLDRWFEAIDKNPSTRVPPVASLFGINKLREVARKIDTAQIQDELAIVRTWHADYHTGTLKKDKETSREQAYNQDFFIKILGYKEKPATPYTFEPKATTDKKQLPDAVISFTDSKNSVANVFAVVELKGASIALDRPQQREGNMSPIQQGFKYKTQYRSCPFVIVSNFWEFRLYNDNQLDYELWTLDDLVDPSNDFLKFKTWYVLLHSSNFISDRGPSKTEELLSDIRVEQEEIGKRFYRVYRDARLNLLRDVYTQKEVVRGDIELGIEKVQKIIDRIVFVCFAEDRGLLPDNIIQKVVAYADKSAFGGSLWSTLKGFFEAVDIGSTRLDIPDGYNGGLFAADATLNALKISDPVLRAVTDLSSYNFVEDLSVNILGHIFEQSISDLESIRQKVRVSKSLPAAIDEEEKQISRRKRDGIYYTPDYVVRYIVDKAVGGYLRAKEDSLKKQYGLSGRFGEAGYAEREKSVYLAYQEFLQNIRVVDPACGSGAFLVHVFDYLLAENQRVDDILGGSLSSLDDYVREILKNNIFGVDLNDESVEITKLSLWLKTAKKGNKLTALDKNIRIGNSLVPDDKIVGSRAFDWQSAFPDVFSKGGFDVVVGNPPYGATIDELQRYYLEHNYATYEYQLNSFSLFYERGMSILRDGGYLGYITPAVFTYQRYFQNLRAFLQKYTLLEVTKYNYEVFEQADIGAAVSWITEKTANRMSDVVIRVANSAEDVAGDISTQKYSDVVVADGHYHLSGSVFSLDGRLPMKLLGEIAVITMGIKPYQVGKGVPKQDREIVQDKVFTATSKLDPSYISCLIGRDFHRYRMTGEPSMWLSYGKWLAEPRENAPFFDREKIVLRQTADSLIGHLDTQSRINLNNVYNVGRLSSEFNIRFVLGLLNSKLLTYVYQEIAQEKGRLFAEVKKNYLEKLPIAVLPDADQHAIVQLVNQVLEDNDKCLTLTLRFKTLVLAEFKRTKWPTRDANWWDLSFTDFSDLLGRALKITEKDELLPVWEKYSKECKELAVSSTANIRKIDSAVYNIYKLTKSEKAMIETAVAR